MRRFLVRLAIVALACGVAYMIFVWKEAPHVSTLGAPTGTYSNIMPGDYVGPKKCAECHAEKHAAWSNHPHSKMNKNADQETVRGDFSGVRVAFPDGEAVFEKSGNDYQMRLERAGKLVRRYKVTRTVGSRFMQFYIGLQLEGPEPKEHAFYNVEQKLPFGYWFKLKRWLPTNYFDPVGPETKKDGTPVYDPFLNPRGHNYSQNCMLCHNTYPYEYRLALPDGLDGYPKGDVLLAVPQLQESIKKTMDLSPRSDVPATVKARIRPEDLVTLGVSCESCHFGGREHAVEGREILFAPTHPWMKIVPQDTKKNAVPSRQNAYVVNAICSQCHCATVTRFPNGAGTWNSREALDMLNGACASQIKCTDCHDPHKASPPEAAPDAPRAINACTKCHATLAADHSKGHPASVTCLDCHMSRITQGLEETIRTHMITRAADKRMVAAGSANACNLCHLDKNLAWTFDALEKLWGEKLDRSLVKSDEPVGSLWLKGEDPSMRLVAGQAWSRSPQAKQALPELIKAMNDPMAVNRVFASFAVERVRGRPIDPTELDVTAPPATRDRQIQALLEAHTK